MSERFKCSECNGASWEDHTFCEALIDHRTNLEKLRVMRQERLLRENPWLKAFEFDYDLWAKKRDIANH